ENNALLQRADSRAKRAAVYGFIKLAIIVLPIILGYFFLQPYLDQAVNNYKNIGGLINGL
ncbi:hypothetical protein KW807_01900, partial [Candidatus Parcubacteria bacterium]|nr:hypothetical protein [Candidatus Parcubacteria bacterium]